MKIQNAELKADKNQPGKLAKAMKYAALTVAFGVGICLMLLIIAVAGFTHIFGLGILSGLGDLGEMPK
jgi:hypothetical protein